MKRICKLCGKEFEPKSNSQRTCGDVHYKSCPTCGKLIEWKGYNRCCSVKCSKEKRAQTNLAKYNAIYPTQNDDIKQKCREAGIRSAASVKHKLPTPPAHPVKRPKKRPTKPSFGHPISGQVYSALKAHSTYIRQFNPGLFKHILEALDIQYETDIKLYSDGEEWTYNFKVDDILICMNDTIFANKYARPFNNYHRAVTEVGLAAGYRVMHIFDWDNVTLLAVILQKKQTIYARCCKVEEIDQQTCDMFLRMYHVQGTTTGQKIRYGLYYNNDLIQVMTFGNSRYDKHYEYEILRMCSAPDMRVVGGASKLFKHFLKEYDPSSVISYCDRSKFTGQVYTKIGMTYERVTSPSIVWSRGTDKVYDRVLSQVGYDNLFGASFGKGHSNSQLMQDSGWLPVYDCGQAVYSYIKE